MKRRTECTTVNTMAVITLIVTDVFHLVPVFLLGGVLKAEAIFKDSNGNCLGKVDYTYIDEILHELHETGSHDKQPPGRGYGGDNPQQGKWHHSDP